MFTDLREPVAETARATLHDTSEEAIAQLREEVPEQLWEPLWEWVHHGSYVEDGEGLPSVSDFDERYLGNFESMRDYAESVGDSDVYALPAQRGGVYIFAKF